MATWVNPAFNWGAAYQASLKPVADPYAGLSSVIGLDLRSIGMGGPAPIPTAAAPAPAPAPPGGGAPAGNDRYVVNIGSKRRLGGWIDTIQYWSDGTQTVIDSIQDMGASDSALAMFRAAGLGEAFVQSLMGAINNVYATSLMPTEGQVLSAIYNSDAYKTRFSANEEIRKRIANGKGRPGDRLLTPKEYIDLEDSYKTILQDAGMPTGFYDQQEDFTNMIANGVSVAELKSRVDTAFEALNFSDENVKNALRDNYGMSTGDMVAYLLDPTRAQPLLMGKQGKNEFGLNDRVSLQKTWRSADLSGTQRRLGQTDNKALSEEIVNLGMEGQAKQAFGQAAQSADDVRRLGSLYGDKTLGFESNVREALGLQGGTEAGRRRKKLASRERAAFSGQSALDRTSLRRRKDS